MTDEVVRAAGGVVWRRADNGQVQVVIIHRPRYDDWSLPKGKAEPGESDEECAIREVAEETGLRGRLGAELPPVSYRDRFGRPKVVRYWAMEVEPGTARAAVQDEVDQIRWLGVAQASAAMTYDRDHQVLAAFAALVGDGAGAAPG